MNRNIALRIVASSPLLKGVEKVEHLNEGYSDDKKYILWEDGEPRYLLRLSSIESKARRQTEFNILSTLTEAGLRCSKPYLFAVTDDGAACYSVLSYIQGENAREALPKPSEAQQYQIGFDAGGELRKLHAFQHPDQGTDWPLRRRAKYLRYLNDALDIGLSFLYQAEIESYIDAHLPALLNSPVTLQHDDYHPGNLIVRDGNFVGIIDFKSDWGDPIEDFYKVPWFSAGISIPFVRGQVDGYLASGALDDFWLRYNLFVAMSLNSSLVWFHRFFPAEVNLWQRKLKEIVETHDFKHNGPPIWYRNDIQLIDVNAGQKDQRPVR